MTVPMRLRVTALGAALLGSLSAYAQPGPGNARPGSRGDDRKPHGGGSGQRPPGQGQRPGGMNKAPQRPANHHPGPGRHMGPSAGSPPPQPRVGHALPPEYRGYNYRVEHWERYGLPRPRRNHHWVQYGAQFVLVGPNGVIVQLWAN